MSEPMGVEEFCLRRLKILREQLKDAQDKLILAEEEFEKAKKEVSLIEGGIIEMELLKSAILRSPSEET